MITISNPRIHRAFCVMNSLNPLDTSTPFDTKSDRYRLIEENISPRRSTMYEIKENDTSRIIVSMQVDIACAAKITQKALMPYRVTALAAKIAF